MAEIAQPIRRAPRRHRATVDVATFTGDVQAALAAFSQDVTYAVLMARSAVTIGRKRQAWSARKELREAEARAHAQCRDTAPFHCHATGPCGVADCKFAEGDLARLDVPGAAGGTPRPQAHSTGGYSLAAAVDPLLDLRAASR